MTTLNNQIIVGIGEGGAPSAVRFAIDEARRTGRPVHLVHVLQLPAGEAYALMYDGAVDSAKSLLAAAVLEAEELAGDDVVVTSELMDRGWAVEGLAGRATENQLLVLEHRALGRLKRVFTGSFAQGVAGRATVPVISVPEGWTPRTDRPPVVTAAVQDPTEAPALLRAAFQEARDRNASVVVLHAWWLASGFDETVVDRVMREEWAARSVAELEPVLAPLRSAFPGVEVTVEVRHAPPVAAVLDAAEASDLLVLGRRHHLLPLGTHLGPVARAALGHAASPVLVTPEVPHTAKEVARERRAGDLIDDLAPLY